MSNFQDIDPQLRGHQSTALPPLLPASSQPQQQYSPHTIYPNTPRSEHDHGVGVGSEGQDENDPKRSRACEACRGLKVRCEPGTNNLDGPCKRCAKANRQCIVTVPSRKRQKKTDSRVAELEKKIDALTQSLQAQNAVPVSASGSLIASEIMQSQPRQTYQQVTNGAYGMGFGSAPGQLAARIDARIAGSWVKGPEFDLKKPSVPPMVIAGQKRKHAETRDFPATPDTRSPSVSGPTGQVDFIQTGFNYVTAQSANAPPTHEYADVIDRGFLSMEVATQMFNYYIERMADNMPAVVFPAGTTAAEIRKSKPVLFLAILAASSGTNFPNLQRTLTKEIMASYAERVICNGQKTLEIVQALQVSSIWYWPPEHFEELKFYQLIHIGAVMAIDIGLGKSSKGSRGRATNLWRDKSLMYPDPESLEARRAWLTSYYLCCNASMGLRRPNLVRWTSFMADCVDVLEQSPDAARSDKAFCQWVRIQHIAEEIGIQFSMDDPLANVSITDHKVQYALKGLERDLAKWSGQVPTDVRSAALTMNEHVVNLYMHEVAMHIDHNVDEFKPPFTEETLRGSVDIPETLTSSHINALSTCLVSIDGVLETFLTFDVETIRCFPISHLVRVAYTVVILIKMYFIAAMPSSELGKVINKDNMKVEQYIDGLIVLFKAAAAEEKSRPSAKFLVVLFMLKTWFHRQRDGKQTANSGGESSLITLSGAVAPDGPGSTVSKEKGTNTILPPKPQSTRYSPANTPLQLLSEVATNPSPSRTNYQSAEWQQYNSTNQLPGYGSSTGANLDPALDGLGALSYTIGEGLEQAMGFTLGVGDFAYLNDDTFFGSLMDSVGGGNSFDGYIDPFK